MSRAEIMKRIAEASPCLKARIAGALFLLLLLTAACTEFFAGVTTVRDLGNDADLCWPAASASRKGKRLERASSSLALWTAAALSKVQPKSSCPPKPKLAPRSIIYKKLGFVQIKIYSSVKPELVPAIIDEAHKNGLRVSGHITAEMTAPQCVELGYDEIQHVNFVILNSMPDIKNTNTIARLVESAKRGAGLDLSSPQVQSFIKLLQDHHTKLDLTLSIFEDQYLNRAGQIPRGFQLLASRLPAQVRRNLLKSFAKMMEFAGLLYRSGIPIEAGTDSMPGFALHHELELDVQAGIPANKVLQNPTLNASRIMNPDGDLGSIAAGKPADVTLVNGDPVANIGDIRKTALVMKDGVLYRPDELYSALGVAP